MRLVVSRLLADLPWLRHGVVAPSWCNGKPRATDNLSFDNGPEWQVRRARAEAAQLLGTVPEHFTHVQQVHGSTVWRVTLAERGKGSSPLISQVGRGDALIACDPSLPIAVLVADCIPLFLVDRGRRAVGLAHVGWRGLLAGVIDATLGAMRDHFHTRPWEISAWVGPGIGGCCFEVGRDVIEGFQREFPGWDDCWSVDSHRVDLKRVSARILLKAGIEPECIDVSAECTVCQPGYFSYRRDRPLPGHNMAAMMVVE